MDKVDKKKFQTPLPPPINSNECNLASKEKREQAPHYQQSRNLPGQTRKATNNAELSKL